MDYERHRTEIVTQAALLRATVEAADLATPVPTCPGWTVGQLLRHLGGGHGWAETIVRTRATEPPSDEHFRDLARYTDTDPAALGAWLLAGAERLADTLRAAGPDAGMWTPLPRGPRTAAFYARRMAHETVVHRADATLAVGAEFTLDADVATDAVDEWLELGSLPEMLEINPAQRELLGPDRTLALQATDAAGPGWVVDLTGETITWRRSAEDTTVTARGPLTDLLLTIYRRLPVTDRIEVVGDRRLFDFWLERVAFG